MGMGRCTGGSVRRANEKFEAATNTGGRKHIHQRSENIVITVVAATAVIHGQMTLGMMLAVQYIIGQLNSPVEQLMSFLYSLQDVKISLERINEIHKMKNEENEHRLLNEIPGISNDLSFEHVGFKYDPHSPKMTIEDVSLTIPETKVTAIVGASGSGKPPC